MNQLPPKEEVSLGAQYTLQLNKKYKRNKKICSSNTKVPSVVLPPVNLNRKESNKKDDKKEDNKKDKKEKKNKKVKKE